MKRFNELLAPYGLIWGGEKDLLNLVEVDQKACGYEDLEEYAREMVEQKGSEKERRVSAAWKMFGNTDGLYIGDVGTFVNCFGFQKILLEMPTLFAEPIQVTYSGSEWLNFYFLSVDQIILKIEEESKRKRTPFLLRYTMKKRFSNQTDDELLDELVGQVRKYYAILNQDYPARQRVTIAIQNEIVPLVWQLLLDEASNNQGIPIKTT